MQTAWIEAPGNLILTATAKNTSEAPWDSAVSRLIAGINHSFGEERFRLLRQRIFTTTTENLFDAQLIKVCAKRVVWSCHEPDFSRNDFRVLNIGLDIEYAVESGRLVDRIATHVSHSEITELFEKALPSDPNSTGTIKRHNLPRPVVALALDSDGQLLAANVNSNVSHTVNHPELLTRMQFHHAEFNLVLSLASQGMKNFPKGVVIHTTLKPCRMCAALLIQFAHPGFKGISGNHRSQFMRVYMLEDDPGRHGRHHLLDDILMPLQS